MSEIAGLDLGVPRRRRRVAIPPAPTVRSRVSNIPTEYKQQAARDNQISLKHDLYSPFTMGDRKLSNYRKVERPTREKCLKRNPFRPSVPYIPQSTILEDQPLVNNDAMPTFYRLGPDSMKQTMLEQPDETVCNNLSEARSFPNQRRRVESMLTDRQLDARMARISMRRMIPNAPLVVNVRKHRQEHLQESPFTQVIDMNTANLLKKLRISGDLSLQGRTTQPKQKGKNGRASFKPNSSTVNITNTTNPNITNTTNP